MVKVVFTKNLARHVALPDARVEGTTVREALEAVFADAPEARGYVLDERGALRTHMTVFVDGAVVRDRETLSDAVPPDGEIYVMQTLSGG